MNRSKRHLIVAALVAGCLLAAIQFIPVQLGNPAVTERVAAPDDVLAILERACFDCHSHETRWPWYARVAPASWLLSHDIEEGRLAMNFSTWDDYDLDEQVEFADLVVEEIEEGEMPPWFYLPLHPEARVDAQALDTLREWSGWLESENDDL